MSDQHSAGEQESGTKFLERAVRHQHATLCCVDTLETCRNYYCINSRAELATLADAKLAGELAGREAAAEFVRSLDHFVSSNTNICQAAADNILRMPLTPESAGVLERHDRELVQQYADRIEHLTEALAASANELERIKLTGEMERLGWEVARRDVFTEAVNALDSLWGAIGDALCSSKGIKREYANAVSKEVAQAKRRCENARELTPDSVDVLERIKRAERAQASLDEAQWWEHHPVLGFHSKDYDQNCIFCQRIAKLRAAAIADGKGDAS